MRGYLRKYYSALLVNSILSTALLISCEVPSLSPKPPAADDPITEYFIPAGAHSANQSSYVAISVDTIKFKAQFDNSAIYKNVDPVNQADINKLYGLSDCNSFHHINSARFGWRWYNNELQILAYTYNNSVLTYEFIQAVSLNTYYTYQIILTPTDYIFKLNNTEVKLPRYCNTQLDGYKLYPYFGGDETAPHDITVKIQDVH